MTKIRTASLLLILMVCTLASSCADSNPESAFAGGPDYVGVWRYQSAGTMAFKDGSSGPGLDFSACSGLDGQMKLRNDGTWSEWRSLGAMFFPSGGRYTVAEGVISFHHSDGRLFETKKYAISGSGVGATMSVTIDNPGFIARCTLTREE